MIEYAVLDTHVRVRAIGETRPAEWLETLSELQQQVGSSGMDAVLDFSRHETPIPTATIDALVSRISSRPRKRRWAFVVIKPVSIGLVNLVRRSLAAANIEVATFETAHDAERWLSQH